MGWGKCPSSILRKIIFLTTTVKRDKEQKCFLNNDWGTIKTKKKNGKPTFYGPQNRGMIEFFPPPPSKLGPGVA